MKSKERLEKSTRKKKLKKTITNESVGHISKKSASEVVLPKGEIIWNWEKKNNLFLKMLKCVICM